MSLNEANPLTKINTKCNESSKKKLPVGDGDWLREVFMEDIGFIH